MSIAAGRYFLGRRISFGIADLALLFTMACWGLNGVITKSATESGDGNFRLFVFNILRFPIAAGLLFLTLRLQGRKLMLRGSLLISVAWLSLISIFFYQIFYMTGQYLTSSANVGIVYGLTPILILLMSALAGIDRLNLSTTLGILISVSGFSMILFNNGRFTPDVGVALLLCAYFLWALYAVLAKKLLKDVSALIVTAWVMLFGSIYQLPLGIWQLPRQSWATLTGLNIFYVILSAVLSLYAGYTLFYFGIARIGPARAGVYTNLMPVFTVMFAVILRGESISPVQITGLLVILAGIAVTKISPAAVAKPASQT